MNLERNAVALLAGLLMGSGLMLSGMTRPEKVLGFLDVSGNWDPSLACVMAAAVLIAFLPFRRARRRDAAWCGERIEWPGATRIDGSLLAGAALFGVGWGLVGYCPGPALVVAFSGGEAAWVFCAAMAAGMALRDVSRRVFAPERSRGFLSKE